MRRARGFTLIEVVIAAGLLVALSTGAAMVLMQTLNTLDRSRHRAMALVLARDKLEQVLSLTWSIRTVDGVQLLLTDEGTQPAAHVDYLDAQGAVVASSAAIYERRWTISRSGTGAAELLTVQVSVTTVPTRADVWLAGARLRRGQ